MQEFNDDEAEDMPEVTSTDTPAVTDEEATRGADAETDALLAQLRPEAAAPEPEPQPEPEPEPVVAEPAPAAADADEEEEEEEDFEDLRFLPGDWYVVHTYAGYENKVRSNLKSRIASM